MGYRNLKACIDDLAREGQLRAVDCEIDPHLEAAEIHRRVQQAGGPALLFGRVKGCRFPLVSNLFGTKERCDLIFRDTLEPLRRLFALGADPAQLVRRPLAAARLARHAWKLVPRRVRRAAVMAHHVSLVDLPRVQCWPDDGGAFITLPAVYTEHPDRPGWTRSNLGMYRIQLSGGTYARDEIGLHYQIHRGIGVHHAAAIARGERLRVNIFVGGPPALTLAAILPLPENMPEIAFAGALAGHRTPLAGGGAGPAIHAEADFCISGWVEPTERKPEGPFGDHLGYYSLAHDFPVLHVDGVWHRDGAIWPFTVVGRPPQEDTQFGALIHELTAPVIPKVLPGVRGVHAVDEAGVHPLLLAIGSERYTPYAERAAPQELLTQAHAILGQGQMSLAKYLLIVAGEDDPRLDVHGIPAFLAHLLSRADWQRDLHFTTRTTIDTLDYSGSGLNAGSKLVIAAAGPPRRVLANALPGELALPADWRDARLALPGIVVVTGSPFAGTTHGDDSRLAAAVEEFGKLNPGERLAGLPVIVVVDDSCFAAATTANFVWTTFTRSNPATDIYGVGSATVHKHWGCTGPLVIDARSKPHHAPALASDPAVSRRVDELAARGGPLSGLW